MIVSMWMTRDVVTIAPATPITEAAALMAAKTIRHLPVVERSPEGARLLGVVSANDILHVFPAEINPFAVLTHPEQVRFTAGEIMNSRPVTITLETPMEEAAREMRDRKIGSLPVVQDEFLVGLITETDIFRAFVSFFRAGPGGLRITFSASPGEDIFSQIAVLARKYAVRVESLIASQYHERAVWIVQIAGAKASEFLDAIRTSTHRILNVLRLDELAVTAKAPT